MGDQRQVLSTLGQNPVSIVKKSLILKGKTMTEKGKSSITTHQIAISNNLITNCARKLRIVLINNVEAEQSVALNFNRAAYRLTNALSLLQGLKIGVI